MPLLPPLPPPPPPPPLLSLGSKAARCAGEALLAASLSPPPLLLGGGRVGGAVAAGAAAAAGEEAAASGAGGGGGPRRADSPLLPWRAPRPCLAPPSSPPCRRRSGWPPTWSRPRPTPRPPREPCPPAPTGCACGESMRGSVMHGCLPPLMPAGARLTRPSPLLLFVAGVKEGALARREPWSRSDRADGDPAVAGRVVPLVSSLGIQHAGATASGGRDRRTPGSVREQRRQWQARGVGNERTSANNKQRSARGRILRPRAPPREAAAPGTGIRCVGCIFLLQLVRCCHWYPLVLVVPSHG